MDSRDEKVDPSSLQPINDPQNDTNDAQTDVQDNYRDALGRFTAGNPGYHVRKGSKAKVMYSSSDFREAISEAITPEEVGDAIRALWPIAMNLFKKGKATPFRILLEHVSGKPQSFVAEKSQDTGQQILEAILSATSAAEAEGKPESSISQQD